MSYNPMVTFLAARHHRPFQFSSVQFARINVVLNASTSGPRHSIIDAVVAGTEKFSQLAGTKLYCLVTEAHAC